MVDDTVGQNPFLYYRSPFVAIYLASYWLDADNQERLHW